MERRDLTLIGEKCGSSRFFTDDGASIHVTLIRMMPNTVSQIKPESVQITYGKKRHINKPLRGHFKDIQPGIKTLESRVHDTKSYERGQIIGPDYFKADDSVDVTGISKGKGFSGCIKRHNFSRGDETHGNSKAHRKPGSIGQCQDPGRVFKGKKMAGQHGAKRVTVQSLNVVQVDKEQNLLVVSGPVPGADGGLVLIKLSVKCRAEG